MFRGISGHRPRYADVVATVALVLAMGGTAYAATVLPAKSVGTKQLQNAAVTNKKLAVDAVGTTNILPQSITTALIASKSITAAQIVPHSLRLSDLGGTDVSGPMSFKVHAGICKAISIGVTGAVVGQVAMLSWEGKIAPPPTVVVGPLKVTAAGEVTGEFCNVGTTNVHETGIGVRVVTFN